MHTHFTLTPNHLKYRLYLEKSDVPNTIQALPVFLNSTLRPRQPITSEHTVVGPGIGALMAQFMWSVCNEGDGVLITTPYFAEFKRDISYPARARVIPAWIPPDVDPLQPEALKYAEDAIREWKAKDVQIRVLLLCNPHNPLARAYPERSILAYAAFAEKHDLHLFVDEVYANQVFPSKFEPNPTPFISILSLNVQAKVGCNPSRIHVFAGPTKDFGSSGIGVGAFVSQHNPSLVKLIRGSLGPIPISSAADALFTPILNDLEFTQWFLEENRRRMQEAFELAGSWCQFHNFPFLVASAGLFFVLNLSSVLYKFGDEDADYNTRIDALVASMLQHGVRLLPVKEDLVKGRFRMTFTAEKDTMLLALKRLEAVMDLPNWKPT